MRERLSPAPKVFVVAGLWALSFTGASCAKNGVVEILDSGLVMSDAGPHLDAGTDAGIDAGRDAGASDAGLDGGADGGMGTGTDGGPDAGSLDGGTDAGIATGTDAGTDAGVDAGMDAGLDAGMDAGPPVGGLDGGFTIEGATEVPATVFVDSQDLELDGGTDLLFRRYQWDFGDPSGAHNQLEGWNAAHTYDTAGTFLIRLTVTPADGGTPTVFENPVTVSADSRTKLYVAAGGSDGNTGQDTSHPIKSWTRMMALLDAGTEVLFNRGDTFTVGDTAQVMGTNMLFGAYGIGALPQLISYASPGDGGCEAYGNAGPTFFFLGGPNAVIQDLSFDTQGRGNDNSENCMPFVVQFHASLNGTATNFVLRRIEALNINWVVFPNGGSANDFALFDNSVPLQNDAGLRQYLLDDTGGEDHVEVGNYVANSQHQHCIRIGGASRVNISENHLVNVSSFDSIDCHHGDHLFVHQNHLTAPLTFSTQWTVFEKNLMDELPAALDAGQYVPGDTLTLDAAAAAMPGTPGNGGADYFMARNNIADHWQSFMAIGSPSTQTHMRIWAYNNTLVSPLDSFVNCGSTQLFPGDVQLANNFLSDSNFSANQSDHSNVSLAQITIIGTSSHNLWTAPTASTANNAFFVGTGLSAAQWLALAPVKGDAIDAILVSADGGYQPPGTSAAASLGTPVPGVFDDYYGNPRPAGAWTAGAVEVP